MHRATRFPNMDALRGIAAMAVLLHHAALEFTPLNSPAFLLLSFNGHGGDLGVLFFFMLSGYLITHRLLRERATHGRIHIGRFYMRRVLRIWPLYYVSLLLGFVLVPWLWSAMGHPFEEKASTLLYATFLSNYDMIWNGPPVCGVLGVHWSVAVEEQFYLFWPLLIMLVRRPWVLASAIAVVVIASEYFAMHSIPAMSYFHLFGNMRYLGIGALLALLVHHHGVRLHEFLQPFPPLLRSAALVLGPIVLYLLYGWAADYPTRLALMHLMTLSLFAYVLLEQSLAAAASAQVDRIPFARWLGERSYGIYLLHMLALILVREMVGPGHAAGCVLLTIALSLLLAWLSHRYVEAPFMRLKQRYV